MTSRRAEFMALGALILAVVTFVMTLQPHWSVMAAGPSGPDSPDAVNAIPTSLNYQGTLRLANGALANATYNMTFRIYNAAVAGTTMHSETINGVVVRDGIFNVVLGDTAGAPIQANVFADAPRFIGVQVGSDPEMVPRQRLQPVPWAQQATQAALANQATTLVSNATVNGLNVSGALTLPSLLRLGVNVDNSGTKSLHFTRGATDGVGAGSIAFRPTWASDALGIIGAGDFPFRKVTVWDNLQISDYGTYDSSVRVTTNERTAALRLMRPNGGGYAIQYSAADNNNANSLNIIDTRSNTSRLFIDYNGDIGIGKTTVGPYKLDVSGKVRASSGFNGTCGPDPGAVGLTMVCNQDVAETFASTEQTEPGDLVVLLPETRTHPTVRLSAQAYEGGLVGVVSTNPGLVFDQGQTYLAGQNTNLITADKTVVAMIGRVPVKVSLENGPIAVGDPLTSSSTPGVAMRANRAGQIIGYALQGSDEAANGKLLAWLQVGNYLPAPLMAALNDGTSALQTVAALKTQNETLAQEVSALRAENTALDARLTALERGNVTGGLPQWALALGMVMVGMVVSLGYRASQRR